MSLRVAANLLNQLIVGSQISQKEGRVPNEIGQGARDPYHVNIVHISLIQYS